ncbi:MAG: hypothetical protein V1874_11275 [Spirochaetota bacterium]
MILLLLFSLDLKGEAIPANSLSVYNGFLTPKDVSEMVSTPPSFKKEYFAAAGFMRRLFLLSESISVEGEGQAVFHYGSQYFKEYVIAPYVRYTNIVDNKFAITGAIGDGISYTEKILNHEHRRDRKSTRYINYLGIEATFGTVNCPLSLVIRLHHRSSAYGLIMNGNTDSNFICLGIRYAF